ncbi:MAG: phage tail protein [Hormoscilla sp. GUM202]|nr:phage tail protein [Hormoscilla sp. GUM202]
MVFSRKDPYSGYNFKIEIDGIISFGFQSCSGLNVETNISTYREGTDKSLEVRKIPGMRSTSNITLTRGFTDSRELWDWRDKVLAAADAKEYRRNMSIILLDDAGNEKIRWNLINCWPVNWSGPELDATVDEFAIETLEIAHEGIKVEKNQWK